MFLRTRTCWCACSSRLAKALELEPLVDISSDSFSSAEEASATLLSKELTLLLSKYFVETKQQVTKQSECVPRRRRRRHEGISALRQRRHLGHHHDGAPGRVGGTCTAMGRRRRRIQRRRLQSRQINRLVSDQQFNSDPIKNCDQKL